VETATTAINQRTTATATVIVLVLAAATVRVPATVPAIAISKNVVKSIKSHSIVGLFLP